MPPVSELPHGPVDVLVTGAAGFVGSALVRALRRGGWTVAGTDLHAGPGTFRADVSRREEVEALVRRLRPRALVHTAAIVDDRGARSLFERVNVEGTRNVLDAAEAHGVERVVHVSSIAALGFDPGPGADARTPLDARTGNPYFDTKARSEALARGRMGRLSLVVVRPGDVYGPGSKPWVDRPVEMMRRGLPVLVDGGRGRMSPCHVDDLVRGLTLALDVPTAAGGIFTIHDGSHTSYRDYFEALARAAGVTRPLRSIPRPVALVLAAAMQGASAITGRPPEMTTGAVRYVTRRASYSLAESREVLGYAPHVSLADGMARLA